MKSLPKKIYVAYMQEGTEDEYLSCDADADMMLDKGETRKIGVYSLQEMVTVKNETTIIKR